MYTDGSIQMDGLADRFVHSRTCLQNPYSDCTAFATSPYLHGYPFT